MKREDFKPGIYFRIDTDPHAVMYHLKERRGLIRNYAMPVNGKSTFAVVEVFAYKVLFSTIIMGQQVNFEVNLSDIQLLTINPKTSC